MVLNTGGMMDSRWFRDDPRIGVWLAPVINIYRSIDVIRHDLRHSESGHRLLTQALCLQRGDQTMSTITLFLDGFYNEKETIKRLLPQNPKDQYVFKIAEALSKLRCTEVIVL